MAGNDAPRGQASLPLAALREEVGDAAQGTLVLSRDTRRPRSSRASLVVVVSPAADVRRSVGYQRNRRRCRRSWLLQCGDSTVVVPSVDKAVPSFCPLQRGHKVALFQGIAPSLQALERGPQPSRGQEVLLLVGSCSGTEERPGEQLLNAPRWRLSRPVAASRLAPASARPRKLTGCFDS